MRISIIVAVAENGVIGDGQTPWRLSSDLDDPCLDHGQTGSSWGARRSSRCKTAGGRDNMVIITGGHQLQRARDAAAWMRVLSVLARAHAGQRGADEIMVIGGGEIYAAVLDRADRVYLTRVHTVITGSTRPGPHPGYVAGGVGGGAPKGPKDEHAATLVVLERAAR